MFCVFVDGKKVICFVCCMVLMIDFFLESFENVKSVISCNFKDALLDKLIFNKFDFT